jgi:hypothetical protein
LVSAAATYAIGATFVNHFEGGGTLLELNLSSMKQSVSETAKKYRNKNKKTDDKADDKVETQAETAPETSTTADA